MRLYDICLICLLLVSFSSASASSFQCKIKYAHKLDDTGKLVPIDGIFTAIIGDTFVVDRETGKILGKSIIGNSNAYGKPQVIDYGLKKQNYKAITIYRPFVSVDYLEILLVREGQNKPFFFYEGGWDFYIVGTCIAQ